MVDKIAITANGQAAIDATPNKYDVSIVGAGPAGLTLAVILARLGLAVALLDDRSDQTSAGRADGIQPKTIETLLMLGLGDELLRQGVRIHDICLWKGAADGEIRRVSREIHYPTDVVDLLHPYILLVHQGMVESVLINDLLESGLRVSRNHRFTTFNHTETEARGTIQVNFHNTESNTDGQLGADYIVGCDGARSLVRQGIPGTHATATPHESFWGVLDGEIDTNFPDLWSKAVVYSEEHGSVLIIPRERNMTRIYIEMKSTPSVKGLGQEFIMNQARRILSPYTVEWRSIKWFGNYQVAQRVATRFSDPELRAFIAGDASHTHSPKAAQGMNTSMHDSWNLGWKLNLAVRGLARPNLLESYEVERKKIAHDLINFDLEHANEIAGGDIKRLAENFRTNTRFISGVGVEYAESVINQGHGQTMGEAKPGCTLPPAKVSRYIDANPVDAQLDIPMLGQFRIYVVVSDLMGLGEAKFLTDLSSGVSDPTSLMKKLSRSASESYRLQPRPCRVSDAFVNPQRYQNFGPLFTFSLLTSTPKDSFEIALLPKVFSSSPWTVYLDDKSNLDTKGLPCAQKWIGSVDRGEAVIMNVRPDGYLGSIKRWDCSQEDSGQMAARWLDEYYDGFLQIPSA